MAKLYIFTFICGFISVSLLAISEIIEEYTSALKDDEANQMEKDHSSIIEYHLIQ
jgi:hypothetical protein